MNLKKKFLYLVLSVSLLLSIVFPNPNHASVGLGKAICSYQSPEYKIPIESRCPITFDNVSKKAELVLPNSLPDLKKVARVSWNFADNAEWMIDGEQATLIKSDKETCVSSDDESLLICWQNIGFQDLNDSQQDEYSFVMFTVSQPISSEVTTKLLSYFAPSQSVKFPKIHRSSFIASNDHRSNAKDSRNNRLTINLGETQFYKNLPIVGILLKKKDISTIARLLNAEYIFQVSRSNKEVYTKLISNMDKFLDAVITTDLNISTMNISLQAPIPYDYDPKEPIGVATKALYEQGVIVVFAAGNYGEILENTMNPWSVFPWVISVGAASSDGLTLWDGSARGIPGDPNYHPTVVAPGNSIPVGLVTDQQGTLSTSLAAPKVTAIAGRCFSFIDDFLNSKESRDMIQMANDLGFEFDVYSRPFSFYVKRMIEDMAREMPGYKEYEVGAGFVNSEIAEEYFNEFGFEEFKNIFVFEK